MMRPAILTLLLTLAGPPAMATPCDNAGIDIDTERPELHARVCRVAEAALKRLAECHLPQTTTVRIEFREDIPSLGGICLGLYHCGEDRIDLLTPEAFAMAHAGSDQFASIPAEAHYDSIIVHELTHAALEGAPCPDGHCLADHEYIAYSMQLGSLDRRVRDRFLAEAGMKPEAAPERINAFLLSFAPGKFAAAAWYHFSAPGNGCETVGRILRGEQTFWRPIN